MTSLYVPGVNDSYIQVRVDGNKNAMALKETETQMESHMMV